MLGQSLGVRMERHCKKNALALAKYLDGHESNGLIMLLYLTINIMMFVKKLPMVKHLLLSVLVLKVEKMQVRSCQSLK